MSLTHTFYEFDNTYHKQLFIFFIYDIMIIKYTNYNIFKCPVYHLINFKNNLHSTNFLLSNI